MKTVRVRIAVGVASSGSWSAAGSGKSGVDTSDREARSQMECATEIWEPGAENPEMYVAEYWVEADVPIPGQEVIEGTVSPEPPKE